MKATITMIGTGDAFAQNYANNNAVIHADGFRLLVDCGYTAPTALQRLGMPFSDLDAVLISHTHSDHVGGLEELALEIMHTYQRKLVLYLPNTLRDPLWEKLNSELAQEPLPSLDDYFTVKLIPVDEPTGIAPGLIVEPVQTEHIDNRLSYSFIINERFFYSADMRFNPKLLHQLVNDRGIQLIFHDCQLSSPGTVHASLDELLTLPESIQTMTKLMHYGDTMPDFIGQTSRMTFLEQGIAYEF
ncbi:MBL fold metallo-hydrolase [Paenibacillus kobensis]|uniref:MBL fold metallo-hydrolase n=1 Tax=Paenibacillus kobensis TaxID=59841 RepID=UPI000FD7FEAF|nr:MBL fold metallo-hydrolase [Paenibacillus kobensis]